MTLSNLEQQSNVANAALKICNEKCTVYSKYFDSQQALLYMNDNNYAIVNDNAAIILSANVLTFTKDIDLSNFKQIEATDNHINTLKSFLNDYPHCNIVITSF